MQQKRETVETGAPPVLRRQVLQVSERGPEVERSREQVLPFGGLAVILAPVSPRRRP